MNSEKNYVWYACYGSNMLRERFLLYVQGGTIVINGKEKSYDGCKDTSAPCDDRPYILDHKLYFAGPSRTWGGGVGSLERYNDGELVGQWIKLPIDEDELHGYYNLYTDNGDHDYFIADYETDLGIEVGEYDNPFKLNELAGALDNMKVWELDHFRAAYSLREPRTIEEVIELIDNLDDYILYPDVKDDDDLGANYMDELVTDKDNWLMRYIDTESLGRDIRLEANGAYTEWGYVYQI